VRLLGPRRAELPAQESDAFRRNVDWSFAERPVARTANAVGFARKVLVDPGRAIHTELAAGELARRVGSPPHPLLRGALYVLQGDLLLDIDGHIHCLVAGDYALMPVGTWHAWPTLREPQCAGSREHAAASSFRRPEARHLLRWFAIDPDPLDAIGRPPDFSDPSTRYVGHYAGTPPLPEALAVADSGRAPPGRHGRGDPGLQRHLCEDARRSQLGADLLTILTVDYEAGGAVQPHDHPFEEAYFFLEGEIEAELDGRAYRFGPGDFAFAGVGSAHGSTTPAPIAFAGSRHRRRSPPLDTPTAGWRAGSASKQAANDRRSEQRDGSRPALATGRCLASPVGLEPTTCRLEARAPMRCGLPRAGPSKSCPVIVS